MNKVETLIRQLHTEPQASEIVNEMRKLQAAEILEMDLLRDENILLRAVLTDAQGFIQDVAVGEEDDIETMAYIERLSGRIAGALVGLENNQGRPPTQANGAAQST